MHDLNCMRFMRFIYPLRFIPAVRIVIAATSNAMIMTNLGYNLGCEYDSTVEPKVSGQATYFVKNGIAGPGVTVGESSALYKELVNDLTDITQKDRIYDVKIEVYRAGDDVQPVYTLTGTKQE